MGGEGKVRDRKGGPGRGEIEGEEGKEIDRRGQGRRKEK